jgi:hypothetical protein
MFLVDLAGDLCTHGGYPSVYSLRPFPDLWSRFTYFSFFRGLLDFYTLNLIHLNPNYVLQIAIFVHICESYLGIIPHFGLWKYLYHCKPGMVDGSIK